jgi:hypothetical protein
MSKTPAKWPLAAATLVAVAALAWFIRPAEHAKAHVEVGSNTSSPSTERIAATEPEPSASTATPRSAIAPSSAETTRKMEEFVAQWTTCEQSDDACKDDPLAASSYEEAVWLREHGYPTTRQLADYEMTATESLRAAAATGDLASHALYGRRLVEEGDYYGGTLELYRAAKSGGYYALYELSDVYMSPDHNAGASEPFAYLRVAYLLGDAKAGRYMAQLLDARGGADIVEMRLIDDRAAQLRKSYGTAPAVPRP